MTLQAWKLGVGSTRVIHFNPFKMCEVFENPENIEAQSYTPKLRNELKNKLNDLTELEKQIFDKLTGKQKSLFLSYTDK